MAEISEYITAIQNASTGKEVRAPLAKALTDIREKGKNVKTLNGKPATDYALYPTGIKTIKVDSIPLKNSQNLVTSNGVYAILGDFNIDWSEDAWQTT